MADTIYLKRGQNLDITAEFIDEAGVPITLDGIYTATSAMRLKGTCDPIILTCTIVAGKVKIVQATDDLIAGVYDIDIIVTNSAGRDITDVFYLNLGKTITPI
jgi:hypothetical protein